MSISSIGLNKCLQAALFCTIAVLAGCDEAADDPLYEQPRDADEQAAGLGEDIDAPPMTLPFESTGDRYTLPARGGFGGGAYTLKCPKGRLAVGIYGRSGAYIDRLGLSCARLYKNGNLGPSDDIGAYGGNGGGAFRIQCPKNQAIVGIYGGAGDYLDRIGLYCADVEDWYEDDERGHTTSTTGGGGGYSFSDECPRRYMVSQFNVRTGIYVDQVEPVCEYIED
jgi:hypothetical protein